MEPLINDERMLERCKVWSTTMEKFCEAEDYKEIDFKEIKSESPESSDDDTPDETIVKPEVSPEQKENTCKALVKYENFEGSTSSDDFDEITTNQTIACMQEQMNRWERSGMFDVLETFDLDRINKEVTPWVEKNKLDKTQLSTSMDEHIVHIEEHHHRQIHVSSDDDSLHSLDTANYIRSSRKKKLASCTTTTIKKFSYVKGSKRNFKMTPCFAAYLDMNKNLDDYLTENFARHQSKKKAMEEEEKRKTMNFTPPMKQIVAAPEPMSLPAVTTRRRRFRQMKRHSNASKRSVSSSSSSSESPARPLRPKYKRVPKTSIKDENSETEKHDSGVKVPKSTHPLIDLTKSETSAANTEADSDIKGNSPPKPQSGNSKATQETNSNNETGFLGASIINSTAVTSNPNRRSTRKCAITPIKNNPEQVRNKKVKGNPLDDGSEEPEDTERSKTPETKVNNSKCSKGNNKILLYSPTKPLTREMNVKGKRFILSREYFLKRVGEKNSHRFIKLNSSKFPFKFDTSSRVYFKIPEESDESASSDEDILSIFGREGEFIVESKEQMEEAN